MDTNAQVKALEDLLDPDKVQVYCADHMYFGPIKVGNLGLKSQMPGKGCAKCWFVFYLIDIARTPPGERQARLDELEEVVHHVVELADRGEWDFEPDLHINIEKDTEIN